MPYHFSIIHYHSKISNLVWISEDYQYVILDAPRSHKFQ